MNILRITKEFNFEMAHALYNHDGKCAQIHGHSYCLKVTLRGKVRNEELHSKNGMVMDFGDLKKLIKQQIIDIFDHALVLNGNSPHREAIAPSAGFTNILLVPYQPSSENLLLDFVERIHEHFPPNIQLYSLKLRETNSSFAEWYAEDNEG
ncbi:MAG TPA: 6-carboxytetrahydropterin synthase [Daejeonella sp.]|nr:6-carboxytetrahydropterin synthase [Daejeonella sp.]